MKVLNYLKGVKREFGLVKWPTKKATGYFTVAVLTISIFFGIYIGLFDVFFANILDVALNLKDGNGFIESVINAFSNKTQVVNDAASGNAVDLKNIINNVSVDGVNANSIDTNVVVDASVTNTDSSIKVESLVPSENLDTINNK